MSLLLDALKKAAKDKESASAKPAVDVHAYANDLSQAAIDANSDVELELEDTPSIDSQDDVQNGRVNDNELTLDEPALALNVKKPSSNTVSDEALQVLIYKTRREHRRKRRIIWIGAMLVSVFVLVASGMYFFNEMQQEVAALERRHQLSMQAVQAEPVKASRETITENQSQNRVVTKQPVADKPPPQKPVVNKARPVAAAGINKAAPATSNVISFARSEKQDPVSTLLNSAWQAYNAADYTQASTLYEQVLAREKNNRDALMGMGAIALKYADVSSAKHYYNRLLQLDPRDAIANAAIINMNATAIDALSESKLITLLRQDPRAAHLHYALGNKYAAQNKWPEAQAAFFSALEHDSSNANYAYNLAVSLERIGKPDAAARYYQSAITYAQNSNISFSLDVVKKRLEQLKP